ncbi:hypothetical protein F2P81_010887 [Scophthalmus maximus]|uniref:DDE-1 domain-containing protein n=1 Tax=Scophthalmus maximus TaxID=52904 RepID=A0A6A4SVS6_SCOMX|nr:hypothetical protein F2P81_010887 [Scophthalmus maximus]
MDEVPRTFDRPLTRTVNRKGQSSVTLKTTGHEKTHFTCVLGCTASGGKLPPMVIFKRTTMPKEKFPTDIVVKVNKKGWMTESLMHEWHTECYGKRTGGFFHKNKALLVMDSMRAHITDSVKEAIKRLNSIPAVIPGGTTKFLQPLDISVNRAFKVALRVQWEAWMTSGEKSFTKAGRMRRATYAQVCQRFVGINPEKGSKATRRKGVYKKTGVIVQKKSPAVNTHVHGQIVLLRSASDPEHRDKQDSELKSRRLRSDPEASESPDADTAESAESASNADAIMAALKRTEFTKVIADMRKESAAVTTRIDEVEEGANCYANRVVELEAIVTTLS